MCDMWDGFMLGKKYLILFKAMHQEIPESKRILELNPKHPLIEALFKVYNANENAPELKTYAKVLFDQSLLTEGSPLPDPAAFAKEVTNLLLQGLGAGGKADSAEK